MVAACGDGAVAGPDPTATPEGTPTVSIAFTQAPTRPTLAANTPATGGQFGPAPRLGGNISKISPEHAQKIPQFQTRSPNPSRPGGICAEVTFDGLPEYGLWFRLVLDGVEQTTKLTWVLPTRDDPEEGKMCYAPADGFDVGLHDVAIGVQDPADPNAEPQQIVAWRFEVTAE
jgi:hypothetical protein